MKKLTIAVFALFVAFCAVSCVEEPIGPLGEDDDHIPIPPPPPPPDK